MILRVIFVTLAVVAGLAQAQPYRSVDDKGRVRYTDTPPSAGAKSVEKTVEKAATPPAAGNEGQVPFELQQAQKDFPVTLFTSPSCKEPCELARALLNKRGIPFAETQVWNEETAAQLKDRTGSESVPVILVGRSTMTGFESTRYDALLDSAGYPKAGVLPARAQNAPAPPAGYEPPPTVEPAKPVVTEAKGKPGPYDPSGLTSPRGGVTGPGPYDPSGLASPGGDVTRPGRYGLPADEGAKRP